MRRSALLLFLLVTTAATATLVASGDDPPLVVSFSSQMVSGLWQPLELRESAPLAPNAGPASEACDLPSEIGLPDGGQTVVNDMIEQDVDPALSCALGSPPGPRGNRGYRTVWYEFQAPDDGLVTIEAFPNADYRENYDTIIAVYEVPEGEEDVCAGLADLQLTCNDDSNGFLSRVTLPVAAGKKYRVEIADWQFGANWTKRLNLATSFATPSSRWSHVSLMSVPRSRGASVVVGDAIYLIGGQTVVGAIPERTSLVERYDTAAGTFTTLAPLPGPDGFGYSNMSAAYLNGRIYVPSGYVGDNDTYDGTHWVYDLAQNRWNCDDWNNSACDPADQALVPPPPAPWPEGEAFGWAQAVAEPAFGGYYLVGGVTGPALQVGAVPRAEMFFFQPSSSGGIWLAQSPMSVARYAHVAARVGGKICVAGGLSADVDGNPIILNSGECFSPAGGWSPTGEMNHFRYNAGSAVGPDGKWYVFGGTNELGKSIPTTEVYDPLTNVWTELDPSFALREPARAWPRGGFVGDELWVLGGHENTGSGDLVVNLVEKASVPEANPTVQQVAFPLSAASPPVEEKDNTFAHARQLKLNEMHYDWFLYNSDFFDFYFFDLEETATVTVRLDSIATGSDYSLALYDANKLWLGSSENVGNNPEAVTVANLPPGRYYAEVIRGFGQPTTDPYTILVER